MFIKVAALISLLPSIKLDIERWKFNEEAQLYVSNKGRVRRKNGSLLEFKVRRDNGYASIYTKESGFWSVHQLVAQTWIPNNDPSKNSVDHLDHNKRNNNVKNLEWCTVAENRARGERDLCYDPEDADRLINKYIQANRDLKKEIKLLKAKNAPALAPVPSSMVVVCNGTPITARELSLIAAACTLGSKNINKINRFISGEIPNKSISVGGMKFTRI